MQPYEADEQMALDIYSGKANVVTEGALKKLFEENTKTEKKSRKAIANVNLPKKNVVMGNEFIVGLEVGTRFAYKISRLAIAQIPMDAETLPIITITADDIEQMGMTRQRLTGHLDTVIDEILDYRIKLASFDNLHKSPKMAGINVFAAAAAIPGKGAITVQLNPILRSHFLDLKADFTQYALPVVGKMPGFAASKLHELLLSRSRKYGVSLLRFSIADLATILNYTHKQDEFKPSTFVTNVIKRAVASINEHTECEVKYKALRTGREYTHIRFYVESEWKTLEEKLAHFKQMNEQMDESPELRAAFEKAGAEILKRLETGEGELNLDAKDSFNTNKVIRNCV